MPIIFHDEVKKSFDTPGAARELLLAFLDEKEPEFVRWLYHTWNSQGRAITYKELREMIMNGSISVELLEEWQQDYSRFVVTYLEPMYASAMAAAVVEIKEKYPLFAFEPASEEVKHWTDTMGAAFVTNSTDEQIAAIRFAVARAAQLQDMGVDDLARVIRSMVGLNLPQTRANLNYYVSLRKKGIGKKRAEELALKYSHRQHRYRAHMIARTELAFAYNKGQHLGVAQAIDRGYMGQTIKLWTDAGDDRVCDTCRELHNRTRRQAVQFNQGFNFKTKLKINNPDIDQTPPAHPHCRCVVVYKEVSPPTFSV